VDAGLVKHALQVCADGVDADSEFSGGLGEVMALGNMDGELRLRR
jgi:hypothetical protein